MKKAMEPKPNTSWTAEQVADWAQHYLTFDDEEAAILKRERVDGRALYCIPSLGALYYLQGIHASRANILWTEIEKLKKAKSKGSKT